MIPVAFIEARKAVCRDSCDQKCEAYVSATLDHGDPHAKCPRAGWILAWGCYGGCDGPAPEIRPPAGPGARRHIVDEPTVKELATNFVGAMESWSAAGFKTVTREEYNARAVVCGGCDYWDGAARLGLGKCMAPGCGCTKFKRWLATEECKHPDGSKWPAIKQPLPPGPPVANS